MPSMNNINYWYTTWRKADPKDREAALGHLYQHVHDQALGAIYEVLKRERRDLATDAASDALLKLPQFRGDSEFATWAYAIARNVALMEARKINARKEVQFFADTNDVESPEDEEAWHILSNTVIQANLSVEEQDLLEAILSGERVVMWGVSRGFGRSTAFRKWRALRAKLQRQIIGPMLIP